MKVSLIFGSQTTVIEISPSDSVSDLKRKIFEQLLVLTSMQVLMFLGVEMMEAFAVSDYKLKEDSCINLTLRKHVVTSSSRKYASMISESPRRDDTEAKIDLQSPLFESIEKSPRSLMKVRFEDNGISSTTNTSGKQTENISTMDLDNVKKPQSFLAKIEEQVDTTGDIKRNKVTRFETNSIKSKYQHKDEDTDIKVHQNIDLFFKFND